MCFCLLKSQNPFVQLQLDARRDNDGTPENAKRVRVIHLLPHAQKNCVEELRTCSVQRSQHGSANPHPTRRRLLKGPIDPSFRQLNKRAGTEKHQNVSSLDTSGVCSAQPRFSHGKFSRPRCTSTSSWTKTVTWRTKVYKVGCKTHPSQFVLNACFRQVVHVTEINVKQKNLVTTPSEFFCEMTHARKDFNHEQRSKDTIHHVLALLACFRKSTFGFESSESSWLRGSLAFINKMMITYMLKFEQMGFDTIGLNFQLVPRCQIAWTFFFLRMGFRSPQANGRVATTA